MADERSPGKSPSSPSSPSSGKSVAKTGGRTPNAIDVHVGSRVRLRRSMQGMSQEKLGDALGVSFQQVQKYEKGTNRIGASRMQQIASSLRVPISFFFEDAPGMTDGAVTGMGESGSSSYVVDFVSSTEGIQLNRAFLRITNAAIRRRVIDMVRTLADETGVPDEDAEATRATAAPDARKTG